jgi:predicted PurR-regulated permease PerM
MEHSAGPRPHEHGADNDSGRPLTLVRRTMTVLLLTAAVSLLAVLFVAGIDILLAAFAGILLGILLRTLIHVVQRAIPLGDGWALATVLVVLMGILGAGGWLLAPVVAEQAEELAERIPQIAEEIEEYLEQRGWGRWLLSQAGQEPGAEEAQAGGQAPPPDDAESRMSLPDGTAAGVAGLLSVLSTWGAYLLTALFVGLFTAANPSLYRNGVVHLFPMRHRARLGEMLDRIGETLRWWLIGQLFAMVLIGVSTTIVLWFFGVPLALILGLIVGLLGFIPYLGPILGLVPVALIAATQGLTTLAYVVVAYTGVQLLEGYVANPLIHQRTVHLPPATTLAIQMLMAAVIGVIGIVLATPLAAVLLVVSQFYRADVLADPDARP